MIRHDAVRSWFRLENYARVRRFSKEEWAKTISDRVISLKILNFLGLTTELHTDSPEGRCLFNYWSEIKYHGVTNFRIPETPNIHSKYFALNELNESELLKKTLSLFPDKDPKRNTKNTVLPVQNPKEDECPELSKMFVIEEEKLNQYLRDTYFTSRSIMEIHLLATDEQLIAEFSQWLRNKRKTQEICWGKRFTEKDFSDWANDKLLPYFDLTTICNLEGIRLPHHVKGDLLFPYEADVNVADRVRKVTMPKAKEVFTLETVEALMLQRDLE